MHESSLVCLELLDFFIIISDLQRNNPKVILAICQILLKPILLGSL